MVILSSKLTATSPTASCRALHKDFHQRWRRRGWLTPLWHHRAPYGATHGKPERRIPSNDARSASPCNPPQHLMHHSHPDCVSGSSPLVGSSFSRILLTGD